MTAGKSAINEKIRNPEEFDLALMPCREKLCFFSFLESIQPMKYIYSDRKERKRKKRKNKEESLQIRDYIHKYTSSYIYITVLTAVQLTQLSIRFVYLLQLYITAVIILNSCNNLQHTLFQIAS